jgi:rod shape-determining protein MreD
MTVFFYLLTLAAGFFLQIVFGHYFSVMGVGPNFLLLLVLAMGFGLGPLVGESMGFIWGLMADLTGLHLFGLNAFILTIFGYAAGKLRRRIDGERATPQVVMACLSTVLSMVIMSSLYNLFEETRDPVGFMTLLISVLLNGLLSAGVFWSVGKWIQIWEIDRDHL